MRKLEHITLKEIKPGCEVRLISGEMFDDNIQIATVDCIIYTTAQTIPVVVLKETDATPYLFDVCLADDGSEPRYIKIEPKVVTEEYINWLISLPEKDLIDYIIKNDFDEIRLAEVQNTMDRFTSLYAGFFYDYDKFAEEAEDLGIGLIYPRELQENIDYSKAEYEKWNYIKILIRHTCQEKAIDCKQHEYVPLYTFNNNVMCRCRRCGDQRWDR